MSKGQLYLIITAVVAVVLFLAYEAFALFNKKAGDTISEYVWTAAYQYPLVPLLFGLIIGGLLGHFFWQRPCP